MKTLLLMRHAEALPSIRDFDRPLSTHGIDQAHHIGQLFKENILPHPTSVICSPARRTTQTLKTLDLPNDIKCEYPQELYNCDTETLVNLVKGDGIILVIGHNPAITHALQHFASNAKNMIGMHPADLAEIDYESHTLKQIHSGWNV